MTPFGSARQSLVVLAALLALAACSPPQPKPRTFDEEMAAWAQVEADVKQMKAQRQAFNARHTLVGKTVRSAAHELEADGYRCAVGPVEHVKAGPDGYRCAVGPVEHVKAGPDGVSLVPVPDALLYCERPSADPQDFCRERHVRLEANWPDATLPLPVLEQQASDVVVTHTTFRCDTPDDVEVFRKQRERGVRQ